MSFVLLGVILVSSLWFYGSYVSVIKRRNKVQEAFASIDVQLKKRYDLIPNILMIAQKFMDHEKSLIEEVVIPERDKNGPFKSIYDFAKYVDGADIKKLQLNCRIIFPI